jgi:hypothetical protein
MNNLILTLSLFLALSVVQESAQAQMTPIKAFNMVTYGAIANSGGTCVSDSTIAFQKAFDAAAAVDGTGYVSNN